MADCSVDGCDRPVRSIELCNMHSQRFWKTGSVGSAEPLVRHGSPEERFWAYVDQSGDCWMWTAQTNEYGYGMFHLSKGKPVRAHRFSYELSRGPIAEGLVIDHTCHNPPCVNPDHLQAVQQRQNVENFSTLRSDNTTGHRDVFFDPRKQSRPWYVRVTSNGKRTWGGTFATAEEAATIAVKLRKELHTNNLADRKADAR